MPASGAPSALTPEMLNDPVLRELADLRARVRNLEAQSPLANSSARDAAGVKRIEVGNTAGGTDYGMRFYDAAAVLRVAIGALAAGGYGINIATGAITINGGTVKPLDADVANSTVANFATLTTAMQSVLTNTHVRPAWATTALVLVTSACQMTNASGAAQNLRAGLRVQGGTDQFEEITIQNATTGATTMAYANKLTGLAANVTVDARVDVSVGTNAGNFISLGSTVIWMP